MTFNKKDCASGSAGGRREGVRRESEKECGKKAKESAGRKREGLRDEKREQRVDNQPNHKLMELGCYQRDNNFTMKVYSILTLKKDAFKTNHHAPNVADNFDMVFFSIYFSIYF